jgi:hypothetical protein
LTRPGTGAVKLYRQLFIRNCDAHFDNYWFKAFLMMMMIAKTTTTVGCTKNRYKTMRYLLLCVIVVWLIINKENGQTYFRVGGDDGRRSVKSNLTTVLHREKTSPSTLLLQDNGHSDAVLHDSSPDTTPVVLMHQTVGNVTRICASGDGGSGCEIFPPDSNIEKCPNVNGPMPIRSRSWMHPELQKFPVIAYYSAHVALKGQGFVQMLGGDETTSWKPLRNLVFPKTRCKSLHSPSILVDDHQQKLYMYIHGHGCGLHKGKIPPQPTLLLYSNDGIHWEIENPDDQLLLEDLFYLTTPTQFEDYYYALAKTQENMIGSAILLRSRSMQGPFEKGPILGHGLRHCDILDIVESTIYVVFSKIGHAPETILLATIEMSVSTAGNDWMEWSLIPGPTILSPERLHEHGNGIIKASKSGRSGCEPVHELRDPKFLPDVQSPTTPAKTSISGLLFYAAQGERVLALARLSIDINLYSTSSEKQRNLRIPSISDFAGRE